MRITFSARFFSLFDFRQLLPQPRKLGLICWISCLAHISLKGRERDVGIICVIIYDDLALEAWTQRKREKERERERKREIVKESEREIES